MTRGAAVFFDCPQMDPFPAEDGLLQAQTIHVTARER